MALRSQAADTRSRLAARLVGALMAFVLVASGTWVVLGGGPRTAGILALLAALLALLWLALIVGRMGRKRWLVPTAAVAWWLGVETWVAPHLGGLLPLWQHDIMQDVDHRPKVGGPGDNADRFRATPEREAFRPDGFNLMFLGDSFTYGFLVEGEEAFPARVRDLLRDAYPGRTIEVANCGWVSASPLLAQRLLLELGDAYHPSVVALCLDMTDFENDIVYQNMLDRRGPYALYDRVPLTLATFQRLAPKTYRRLLSWSVDGAAPERFFANERPLEETRSWLAHTLRHIEAIHAWCDARGVDFVLFVLPRHFQYDARECLGNWEVAEYTLLGPYSLEPFRFFDELRPNVVYPIVSLLEALRDAPERPLHFEHDPHWTARGHAVAARAVFDALAPICATRLGGRGR